MVASHLLFHALPILAFMMAGCAHLSTGNLKTLAQPSRIDVCLVRGFQDWYSTGLDQLTLKLRSAGVHAEAFRESQWRDLADELLQHPHHRIILIGFSYGADDVILIARRLNAADLPVDLLITIDPVTPAHIPANVRQCVNFYEPNGFWDIFPWLRGIPVTPDPGASAQNINIRTDLNEPDTSHATIAGNEHIHRCIQQLIIQH